MRASLRATRRSLEFRPLPGPLPDAVDIFVDGHRVWSVSLGQQSVTSSGSIRLRWPAPLGPFLSGVGTISVRASSSGELIAAEPVRIGPAKSPIEVRNPHGQWLAVNKWLRLSTSVEGDSSGLRERLLEHSKTLIQQLEALGYAAYICSGTLLGAVRNNNLLPHDDDVDFGILLPHSDPADLSLDSYRLEDQLLTLGYTVVRHSNAHLQVVFLTAPGEIDHYIDLFSAFYRTEAEFCQPFHIRADVPRASIVPTKPLELAGIPFPAPAVPDDWLASCYGPSWATPDPSFSFTTPLATRRRFDSWFGALNTNREYWEALYKRTAGPADAAGRRRGKSPFPLGASIVDLGCGTGMQLARIAGNGHDVIGVDYSYRALAIAGTRRADLDLRYLNLYDRRRLLEFGAELVRSGHRWFFNLAHVLEGLTQEGRENVFLFLHLILDEDAFALASFDTNFSTRFYRGDNPETWHLPVELLRKEAGRHQLQVDILSTGARRTGYGRRGTATATLRRESSHEAQ